PADACAAVRVAAPVPVGHSPSGPWFPASVATAAAIRPGWQPSQKQGSPAFQPAPGPQAACRKGALHPVHPRICKPWLPPPAAATAPAGNTTVLNRASSSFQYRSPAAVLVPRLARRTIVTRVPVSTPPCWAAL